jgi:BirA family biotin operon repressor/biotin-[acetyl-CoA-carboxylase] ligase
MIIFADNQTGGVGTHERKWFTGREENLSFDIVFTPNCNISKISKLTYVLAECFVKTLETIYNIKTTIKEPNDIILNGKKMAGIITETSGRGENIKKIFIGIGINVNQMEFPGNLKEKATSLKKEFNKDFDRIEIFTKFLEEFEIEYIKMINDKDKN